MTEKQAAQELIEIKDEIQNKIYEARQILKYVDKHTKDRAMSYWVPQIETALSKDHDWLGGSMCTMEDTINELDYDDEDEEEEEYEE